MRYGDPVVFALGPSREFGARVATAAGLPFSPCEERDFPDGEHKSVPLGEVCDRDAYVIQSLYADLDQSVNDKLCRLLFFAATLRDAGAGRVTAVVPYLCYSRVDRRKTPSEPVTTRYVAGLLESAGVQRVVTLDVHDVAAYQNAYRIPAENMAAARLFAGHFEARLPKGPLVVVSPDPGGVKRAEQFRQALSATLGCAAGAAFVTKRRTGGEFVGQALVSGEVEGRTAIVYDDIIATGATVLRAARACREAGAVAVHVAATHGLFSGDAPTVVADEAIDQVVVTDTVPPFRVTSAVRGKVTVLGAAEQVGEAIRRLHQGRSLAEMVGV
jgi:ribose-phosphate pyrophosphokinase